MADGAEHPPEHGAENHHAKPSFEGPAAEYQGKLPRSRQQRLEENQDQGDTSPNQKMLAPYIEMISKRHDQPCGEEKRRGKDDRAVEDQRRPPDIADRPAREAAEKLKVGNHREQ